MRRARLAALALLALALAGEPERAPASPYDDCGYVESAVDLMDQGQLDDLRDCLDRFGWTYDELDGPDQTEPTWRSRTVEVAGAVFVVHRVDEQDR
jgi:hypothetical protein